MNFTERAVYHTAFVSQPLPFQSCRSLYAKNVTIPTCSITAPERAATAAKKTRLPSTQHHFLHVDDLSSSQLSTILSVAENIKSRDLLNDPTYTPLLKKAMSMLFAKPSARTRVSFETAMFKAGGHALCLGPEVGVGTREAAKDVARVLAGMTDIIMARLFAHEDLIELAEYSTVPVINGLTNYNHPCQIVADALTIVETRGSFEGAHVVYIGDGNNIVHSWLELAARLPFQFTCCCPIGYEPDETLLKNVKNVGVSDVKIVNDPREAIIGADYVYADVWASMGQKEEIEERERAFKDFHITHELMQSSGRDTKFLHCLPAERGREVSDEVMESDYSIVFQQAENRMHAQFAIMLSCMGIDPGV